MSRPTTDNILWAISVQWAKLSAANQDIMLTSMFSFVNWKLESVNNHFHPVMLLLSLNNLSQ